MIKDMINEFRLDAGIARLSDSYDYAMVVLDKEGKVIDPLEGLSIFAQLIVKECLAEIERCGTRSGDTEHNLALRMAWHNIKDKFGLETSS